MEGRYIRQVKDYYEQRAVEYDATSWEHPQLDTEERTERDELVAVLRALPPATTLDVACGTAYLTQNLPGEIVATDYSPSMLAQARRTVPSARFVRCDGLRLPFRDGTFERVFTSNFYGHLEPPEAQTFLTEVRRVASHLVVVDAAYGLRTSENDWEERTLSDGSLHKIYKRFFTPEALADEIGGHVTLFSGHLFIAVAT